MKISYYFTTIVLLLFSFSTFTQTSVTSTASTFNSISMGGDCGHCVMPWYNASNAQLSDNTYARSPIDYIYGSEMLTATGFSFNIPSGMTIDGIEVEIERYKGASYTASDRSVKIIKAGTKTGTDHASSDQWPTSDGVKIYGGSADLWGTTWTPADINAANFGVGIATERSDDENTMNVYIDYIRITVYYSSSLPVELIHFNATPEKERKIKTDWSTATEINNAYFDIERSQDAIHFEKIDSVLGAGNSNTTLNYIFYDANPYTGISYYRLKQVDYNGQFQYSPIRTVYIGNLDIISIYPNPSVGSVKYVLASEHGGLITIKVLDVLGREVYFQEKVLEEDSKLTTYEISTKEFSKGAYFLQITTPQKEKTQKQFLVD